MSEVLLYDDAAAAAALLELRRRRSERSAPHVEYQNDPVRWAVERMGIPEHTIRWSLNAGYDQHVWDGTADPLVRMAEALVEWKHVGCEAATTTGKSYWVAILIYWFLACFQDSRVFTLAPKEDQLKLFIWMEMQKLWPRFHAWFPSATFQSLSLRMRGGIDDSWAAIGYPVGVGSNEESAGKAQGMHAEHMLLVYEETPGIPLPVIIAGINTAGAPHNLRVGIGNPNHQLDALHTLCKAPRTVAVRISAYDHPNVVSGNANLIPGAVSQQSIDERLELFGEESPVFQSRVRGVSPEQASNALIRLEWLRASAARYAARIAVGFDPRRAPVTGKGVDVANSEHGDRACIVDFSDNVCVRLGPAFQCADANVLGADVVAEAKRQGVPGHRIGVDAIGVGAGTVNEARRLGTIVQALYSGSGPMKMVERAEDGQLIEWSPDVNLFQKLRSQMWWQLREDFRKGIIDVPENRRLWEELVTPTFDDESKTLKVMEKADMKSLLNRSPDTADALVYANWVRQRAVLKPKVQLRQQGQSAGYDYLRHRPASKLTADDEIEKILAGRHSNIRGGRYSVPVRRDR